MRNFQDRRRARAARGEDPAVEVTSEDVEEVVRRLQVAARDGQVLVGRGADGWIDAVCLLCRERVPRRRAHRHTLDHAEAGDLFHSGRYPEPDERPHGA